MCAIDGDFDPVQVLMSNVSWESWRLGGMSSRYVLASKPQGPELFPQTVYRRGVLVVHELYVV